MHPLNATAVRPWSSGNAALFSAQEASQPSSLTDDWAVAIVADVIIADNSPGVVLPSRPLTAPATRFATFRLSHFAFIAVCRISDIHLLNKPFLSLAPDINGRNPHQAQIPTCRSE